MDKEAYASIIRKRRALARDYFINIPEKWIILDLYGFDQLTQEGLTQRCGAVGCVAGWLQTMPEFREWRDTQRPIFNVFFDLYPGFPCEGGLIHLQIKVNELGAYLGVGAEDYFLFESRRKPAMSEKQEAMERLDALQELPITYHEEEIK